MKTKKVLIYVLITLFIFSPFLGFEVWAFGQRIPTTRAEPSPTQPKMTYTVCQWDEGHCYYCCYEYTFTTPAIVVSAHCTADMSNPVCFPSLVDTNGYTK